MRPIAQSELSGVLRSGWRRFFYARRPSQRSRAAKRIIDREAKSEIDPIALTVMAVDRLGPARLRTAFHGVPVTVAAPDHETAEIFRAALSQLAKDRPTDRLISVELTADKAAPAVRSRQAS